MGAPPGAEPEVLPRAGVAVADPLGVSHPQGPHPVADRPGDHRPGGLVVSLADPPPMAGLLASAAPPQLAPAPRSPLAPARGLAPHLPSPGLGVGKVQVAFGPHRPPRHQQGLVSCDHGEGWMMPGSTPATTPGSRPWSSASRAAVTSTKSRPASLSRVTERMDSF